MNVKEILIGELEDNVPDKLHLDIIKAYLIDDEFDGLSCDECCCEVKDLAPCGNESFWTCEPGYKVPCPGPEYCSAEGDCPWHIEAKP